jgi:hypothetical protein
VSGLFSGMSGQLQADVWLILLCYKSMFIGMWRIHFGLQPPFQEASVSGVPIAGKPPENAAGRGRDAGLPGAPLHRPVLALLAHTIPTSDGIWRRSVCPETDAGRRPPPARRRGALRIAPTSDGSVDSYASQFPCRDVLYF